MTEGIKDKASRYRNLTKDETFQELMEIVADRQIDVFLDKSSNTETIDEARSIVLALKQIEAVIQSIFDEEKVFDQKHNS